MRDGWKPTFPGIDQVFQEFVQSSAIMSWAELTAKLDNCALLTTSDDFPGTVWMTNLAAPIWSSSVSDEPAEAYQPLIRLLHNVGFLGFITSERDPAVPDWQLVDEPVIYSHDNPDFPDHVGNLKSVTGFVIHSAFRPALEIPG